MSMTNLVLLLVLCALPARMADRPLQASSAVAVDSRSHFTTARDHRVEHTEKSHHTSHTNHHTAALHSHSTSELHDDVIASAHRATVAAENRTSHHTMTLHNELESHQGDDSSPAPGDDSSPASSSGSQATLAKGYQPPAAIDLATAAIGSSGKASCPCMKNNRPKVDCHSPLAIDGKCVEATDAGQAHDDGFLAVDYGEECRAHIDPKWAECSDPATEMPWKQSCKEAPDLKAKMQCRHDFCDLLFCFVDPVHCDVFHRESGRWGGRRYSYATCGHNDQPRVTTKKKDEESISSRAALSAFSFLVVVARAF